MKRRIPSLLIGAIGIVLILIPVSANLFRAAPAFERLTDNFRPEMEAAERAALRRDLTSLAAVPSEFTTKAVPELAAALNMSPQQLSAVLAEQYPAVAAGLQSVPRISGEFTGVLNLLDDEAARFEQADAIPMGPVPATTVPWAVAGAGVLCVAVAFFVPRRRGAATAVLIGLLLVVGPLVLSLPAKADAADTMNSNLKPVYTAELVSAGQQSLAGMRAMGTEIETKLLPGLAGMLRMTPEQLQEYLAGNFPAVAAGVATMPAALDRFDALVGTFDRSLADYDRTKGVSLLPIAWMLIVGGLLTAGIAGASFVQTNTRAVAGAPRDWAWFRGHLGHVPGRERLSH